ncbi:TPA: glycosyltransferase [Streptococcus agalactiae]|uniref:glycosyltransferase n=1 Tax=Streptococcus agalactiae TaxID=1311 RepID=UPI0002F74C81|nr:glycosyltransferase [Streptococcus agalactiae]HEO0328828.1 glycosyl hydrolase family 8 [Streptococcus agalactiae]
MTYQKTVVLAGDYSYIRQIETTLKSLCVYHENLSIFIFNQDIPQEWFLAMKDRVGQTGNQIQDVKLFHDHLSPKWENKKLNHINYMTYARYFIPQYISADTVLYLDSDLVVTTNLDNLFQISLDNAYLAAVPALFGLGYGFNAGVMVINNQRWRQENMTIKLIEKNQKEFENANEGDQTILNRMFENQVIYLDDTYNFQIGFDMGAAIDGHKFIFDIPITPLPKIIHYISGIKPWQTLSNMRLREVWWHYNLLEWSSIISSKKVFGLDHPIKTQNYRLNFLIVTTSDCIPSISELVTALPDCLFHIAAPTVMSDILISLLAFENIRLHKTYTPPIIDKLLAEADIYLDINVFGKMEGILQKMSQSEKPILTTRECNSQLVPETVFASIDDLINYLQSI